MNTIFLLKCSINPPARKNIGRVLILPITFALERMRTDFKHFLSTFLIEGSSLAFTFLIKFHVK